MTSGSALFEVTSRHCSLRVIASSKSCTATILMRALLLEACKKLASIRRWPVTRPERGSTNRGKFKHWPFTLFRKFFEL